MGQNPDGSRDLLPPDLPDFGSSRSRVHVLLKFSSRLQQLRSVCGVCCSGLCARARLRRHRRRASGQRPRPSTKIPHPPDHLPHSGLRRHLTPPPHTHTKTPPPPPHQCSPRSSLRTADSDAPITITSETWDPNPERPKIRSALVRLFCSRVPPPRSLYSLRLPH